MNKTLTLTHTVFVALGAILSGYLTVDAILRSNSQPPWISAEHLSAASTVFLYSLLQLWFLAKRRLSFLLLVTYPPLYIITGLLIAFTVRSSYKAWAPATTEEAFWANVLWFSACGILVAACFMSVLLASKTIQKRA
jgi:hypothetical protein